jgi:hypothetical protein
MCRGNKQRGIEEDIVMLNENDHVRYATLSLIPNPTDAKAGMAQRNR